MSTDHDENANYLEHIVQNSTRMDMGGGLKSVPLLVLSEEVVLRLREIAAAYRSLVSQEPIALKGLEPNCEYLCWEEGKRWVGHKVIFVDEPLGDFEVRWFERSGITPIRKLTPPVWAETKEIDR